MCERMLEEIHAVRREVKGSDIEAFGKSVTWWVGVGDREMSWSGGSSTAGLPLVSRKQKSQSLTHHLLLGGSCKEDTHCLAGGTVIEILMVREARGGIGV